MGIIASKDISSKTQLQCPAAQQAADPPSGIAAPLPAADPALVALTQSVTGLSEESVSRRLANLQATTSARVSTALHDAGQQTAQLAADVGMLPEPDQNDLDLEIPRIYPTPNSPPQHLPSPEWTAYQELVDRIGAQGLRMVGQLRVPREAQLVDPGGRLATGRLVYIQLQTFEWRTDTQGRIDELKEMAEHLCAVEARQELYQAVEAGVGMPLLILRALSEGDQASVYAALVCTRVTAEQDQQLIKVAKDAREVAFKVISPKEKVAGVSSLREAAIGSKFRSKYLMTFEKVGWLGIREVPNCTELWPCLCMITEMARYTVLDLMNMGAIGKHPVSLTTRCSANYAVACLAMALEALQRDNIVHRVGIVLAELLGLRENAYWHHLASIDQDPLKAFEAPIQRILRQFPLNDAQAGMAIQQYFHEYMVILGGARPALETLLSFAKLAWPEEDVALVSALAEPLYFKRATPADILRSHLAAASLEAKDVEKELTDTIQHYRGLAQ